MARPRTRPDCEICGGTYFSNGLCRMHYSRKRRGTPMEEPARSKNKGKQCSLCESPATTRGWCQMHYLRFQRHGDATVRLREYGSGRSRSEDGYEKVWMPDHPNAQASGWIPEHRYVMTEFLGRPLSGDENVHHRNGVRNDNRIENLELWVSLGSQPKGQHVPDLIAYANEIIARYGNDPAAIP